MPQFFYFLGDEAYQPETLVAQARAAEEAGFDGLMISEHFHPWVDDAGAAGFAFSTLGALAQATDRVRLMTGVTTPLFRFHPALIAQAAATIDRLSHGRFDLGVGTGENINEGPLGYEFPIYGERRARMKEALDIMRRLLAGEGLTYDGAYYKTDRAKLYSPPAHEMKIYMAAGGPRSAALAGEASDGVIVSVKDPDEAMRRVVDPAQEAAGEKCTIIATRWSVFAEDDDRAWEALRPWRGLRAPGRGEAVDPRDLRERADGMDRSEILNKYFIVKSEDEYVEAYKPLVTDIGADVVVVQTTSVDQERTIEMLGREVLPELRS